MISTNELEQFFGGPVRVPLYTPEIVSVPYKNADKYLEAPVTTMPLPEVDLVNHPPHYTSHPSGVECIEITQHYNFCVGNAIKYLWRNGLKVASTDKKEKQIEDLEKAIWYIKREIKNLSDSVYE